MAFPLHSMLTPSDGIHTPHSWTFTDQTARESFTGYSLPTAQDLGKFAYQEDNKTSWKLINYSPITWQAMDPNTGGVSSFNGRTGAVIPQSGDYTANQVGAIAISEKGTANGVCSLDSGGKVPVNNLPASVMTYEGTWNASTNTPTLSDATGEAGQIYIVSVAGIQNLGSGNITFEVGDWAIHNGSIWQKSVNSNTVASVFGRTGAVVATAGDYTASQITNIPSGNISATTVQAAIDELDSEKEPLITQLPISKGGTGATDVTNARANLGVNFYSLGGCYLGSPQATTKIWIAQIDLAEGIIATLQNSGTTGSVGKALTAPTTQVDCIIKKNGSQIGTISFATTGNATITWTSTSIQKDDVLTIETPSNVYSIADLTWTLRAVF